MTNPSNTVQNEFPELVWKKARDIGRAGRSLFTPVPCIDCGDIRWIPASVVRHNSIPVRCNKCAPKESGPRNHRGADSGTWKGGKQLQPSGYIIVRIFEDDPMYCMTTKGKNRGRVFEHRLVMARHMGRPLEKWEVVHHKNGNKQDNRISNLELVIQAENLAYAVIESQINELQREVAELKKENKLLNWKLKLLRSDSRYGNPERS